MGFRSGLAKQFLVSLRQSEFLPAVQWPAYQERLLERVCRHAAAQVPFYRTLLSPVFESGDSIEGRFLFARWKDVPILSTVAARQAGDALFAQSTPPAFGNAAQMTTSGSTQRALAFRTSALAQAAGMAMFERLIEWHGIDPASTLCWIRFDPALAAGPRMATEWNLSPQSGRRYELSKAANSRDALAWMIGIAPQVLMTTPSMVEALVVQAERDGVRTKGLAFVIVTSETVPEGLRERVARVFGAKLVDHYGARETGEIAIECPSDPRHKHVSAEIMLVEIVDDDGVPVAPGRSGRVVVTPFYNYAMPLIRYDVGDIAVQGVGPCACRRSLPIIREIVGRQGTLLRLRDGTRRWPAGILTVSGALQADHIQFIQCDYEDFEVRYVPKDSIAQPDESAATRILRERIHPDLTARFVPVEQIERGAGGKYEWFISRVPDA